MISNSDTEKIVRLFARLKGIPVAKVLRNAARDVVAGAFKKIPVSKQKGKYPPPTKVKEQEYAGARHVAKIATPKNGDGNPLYLPFGDTYANGNRVGAKRLRYLKQHRLRSRKGYSKYTWTGFYNLLGMGEKPSRPANAPKAAPQQVEVQRTDESITLTAPIKFTSSQQRAAKPTIIAAGFAQARKNLRREMIRVFRAVARGESIR